MIAKPETYQDYFARHYAKEGAEPFSSADQSQFKRSHPVVGSQNWNEESEVNHQRHCLTCDDVNYPYECYIPSDTRLRTAAELPLTL